MANTKRQKERERWANIIEGYVGKNQTSNHLRAANRRGEKRKRAQLQRLTTPQKKER